MPTFISNVPQLSIIITTHNSDKWIVKTLDSIVQTCSIHFEILIVDDGSTDHTKEVIQRYPHPITLIELPLFGGPSRGRAEGLRQAQAPIVAFCDDDDIWLPNKINRQFHCFNKLPNVDIIFGDAHVIDENDNVITDRFLANYHSFRRFFSFSGIDKTFICDGERVFKELIKANFIPTSSVAARKEAIWRAGGFDESIRNSDDRSLWFRLARNGSCFAFIDLPIEAYRKRSSSISSRGWRRADAQIKVLKEQRVMARFCGYETLLDRRIREVYYSKGWGLADAGYPCKAFIAYLHSMKFGLRLAALRGSIKCFLLMYKKIFTSNLIRFHKFF
jgi:glycosyltransferase involved in cell wall biosynthesis